ncbi:IS66 family transposase, partial [Salmonella enterica subsp. enterica]|nr:IS66 family transposase [Salmonella enterica subsp. enterica]
MRNGFNGLASKVQNVLKDDPFSGHLFIFRGRWGDQIKVLWADSDGLCLFTKRLERGRFVWPVTRDGKVHLTPAQLSMLEGMETSLAHENARLWALLQTQQDTIRQMAEYNRLLSQRVAAYASEINRLKALVAKLQRMQFGKSSEKLRAKTERQIQEAQERISALQEEMAETLGEQYDPALPSALRQSSARKPLLASLPRETRVIRPEEECCPACGGDLSPLGCDVSEQLELISSAFKVIETQRPKLACCRCDVIVQAPVSSKPIARSYAGPGLLAHVVTGKYADHLPLYRQSEIYRRQGVDLSRATLGRWTGAVAELLEPVYDELRQYVLMPGKVHADDIPVPVQEPGSGKTRTVRLWVYVRDDRNAGSEMPPAVWFAYSPDRKG